MKFITTSWDDGYPSDFRLAELMNKYGIQGTFYIPKYNKAWEVMTEDQIVEMSKHFEVGGHTINHVKMNRVSEELFEREILGCYNWLTDLLGEEPQTFCFPWGKFNRPAIEYGFKTGFKLLRTTELLNPLFDENQMVLPTTLQVVHHSTFTYFKHMLKRFKFRSMGLYIKSGMRSDLLTLLDYYLKYIDENGGCLHLWGHTWELDMHDLWDELEEMFKVVSNLDGFQYVPNKALIK